MGQKFCPRCGSENIKWILPQEWSKWRCQECGYMGPLIVEDGEIGEKIRENYLKKYK